MQGVKSRPRVVIENVQPEIDAGRFPIKRTVGDNVVVEADVFADGHDEISAVLLYRKGEGGGPWSSVPMTALGNDRWQARFTVQGVGRYTYTVRGWIDHFKTWRRDLRKRLQAPSKNIAQDLYVVNALKTGRVMVKDEDVCLHCGLCAERCPTGAWDMQKFLLEMATAGPACRSKA